MVPFLVSRGWGAALHCSGPGEGVVCCIKSRLGGLDFGLCLGLGKGSFSKKTCTDRVIVLCRYKCERYNTVETTIS